MGKRTQGIATRFGRIPPGRRRGARGAMTARTDSPKISERRPGSAPTRFLQILRLATYTTIAVRRPRSGETSLGHLPVRHHHPACAQGRHALGDTSMEFSPCATTILRARKEGMLSEKHRWDSPRAPSPSSVRARKACSRRNIAGILPARHHHPPCAQGRHALRETSLGFSPCAIIDLLSFPPFSRGRSPPPFLLPDAESFEDVVEHFFGRHFAGDLRQSRCGLADIESQILFGRTALQSGQRPLE